MTDDKVSEKKMGSYLRGELFWELSGHESRPTFLTSTDQEDVDVLSRQGHDAMRIRITDKIYDVHLSWQKAVPPTIQEI